MLISLFCIPQYCLSLPPPTPILFSSYSTDMAKMNVTKLSHAYNIASSTTNIAAAFKYKE